MKKQQNNGAVMLWWGSALLTGGFPLYLIWLLSTTFVPIDNTDGSPVAIMVVLSAESEFTPILEQKPAVGITQAFNEPMAEQFEAQPEEVNDFITLPELPNASLIVEKKVVATKKEPAKVKPLQPKVREPRQPVIESMPDNHSHSTPPAAATSTPLSGESHQVAAAANSDSSHIQNLKMNWRGRLQGHLAKFKRYPFDARKKRQEGTATIRFVVNQDGYVLSAKLINSSGVGILDAEALAAIKRAQPLPKPPAELIPQGQITLTLPVGFNIKSKRH
ncbi:putative TonB protein [Yersinia frederiksenii]|nr:putative TonB protein [Yersinia frederiksenii]